MLGGLFAPTGGRLKGLFRKGGGPIEPMEEPYCTIDIIIRLTLKKQDKKKSTWL
jgi:hypothetical protein